jgi:Malectin domain
LNNCASKMYPNLKLIVFVQLLIVTLVSAYEVISAINCGGTDFVDTDGHQYSKDTNFSSGSITSNWASSMTMGDVSSVNRPLYLYFRFSRVSTVLTYRVPVTGDGTYVLILKFSDTDNSREKYHVFNVTINGQPILEYFDIYQMSGKGIYDAVIKFQVCDGFLVLPSMEPTPVSNMLELGFHPVTLVATIDAILLLKGDSGERISLTSSPSKVSPITFEKDLCAPTPPTTESTTTTTPSRPTTPTNPGFWHKLLTSIVNVQSSNNTYINVINNFGAKNKDPTE